MDAKGSDLFMEFVRGVEENIGLRDGTYLDNADGFVHCSYCKEAMQHVVEINGEPFKVPSMCACRWEKYEAEEERRKRNDEMQRISLLKQASLMDERFFASSFDAYDETKFNKKQLRMCKIYADRFDEMADKNQGLLLYGGIGTGKTFTAACIANDLIKRMVPVVMTSFVRILQSIQGFKSDNDEKQLMSRLMRPKLLIVDDLGAERSTDYALEKVYNVIDSRYRTGKSMILTTNLTLKEMQDATDIRYARIYDRVFEVCYPMEFIGPSWRKQEAAVRRRNMEKLFEEE